MYKVEQTREWYQSQTNKNIQSWRYICQSSSCLGIFRLVCLCQYFKRLGPRLGNNKQVSVFGVFLVRIFPHSGWIWRDTEYISLFSPNSGKDRPEKLRIRTIFTQCRILQLLNVNKSFVLIKHQYKWSLPSLQPTNNFSPHLD